MSISFSKVLTKVFGSRNDRLLKKFRTSIENINAREPEVRAMTDDQLRDRTQELRRQIADRTLNPANAMPEAMAIIRESMDRHIGIREILNPEQQFDPARLDSAAAVLYEGLQQQMIQTGESWEQIPIPHPLYEAVRTLYPESRPPFRARCFDVQLIGGLVLYEGKIAEMATGEGKTFVAPLACFLKALEGNHCHVVTVNDYLVRRDAAWVRPAFANLGMSVGYIQADMEPGGQVRRNAYLCDITYGTNSEFGFDYLRDNMRERVDLQVQGPLHYTIVDEVDSILIDEARTPLIISGAARDDAPKYLAADAVARRLLDLHRPFLAADHEVDQAKRGIKSAEGDVDKARTREEKDAARPRRDEAQARLEAAEAKKASLVAFYEVELDRKSVHMSHEGIAAAQDAAGVGSFYIGENMEWPHLMEQALRAHVVYERDKDYVVERGPKGEMEIVIIDEFTGRKMTGRQWSDGLHQAIEAKERVPIKQETQTLATITLQNFFKLYRSLAGMTGTAQTEAEEFSKIYRLEVVTIPTNRPVVRADHDDRVYRTEREKWDAIIEEIKEHSDAGRPVLVGTTSVEKSEMLSQMLMRKYGVAHEVLNAKANVAEREASIVAVAGQQHEDPHGMLIGNVTIATNMAGRGTDIKLIAKTHSAGGLHVIGTERHTARRIDNQLRGRSGRQGDPGSSRFYVSLQDELMKLFAGEWTINVLKTLGMGEGEAIENTMISKSILRAQKKVEERNFLARKNLLEYDEVMDHQRTSFYGMRQKVLVGREVDQVIWGMIGDSIRDAVDKYITKDHVANTIVEWARINFDAQLEPGDLGGARKKFDDVEAHIKEQARAEAETGINATLGEFMGDEPDDPEYWDIPALIAWAQSKYGVKLHRDQIRNMTSVELEEALKTAAVERINERDCAGVVRFLEPLYAQRDLSQWAHDKFAVDINPAEFIEDARDNHSKPAPEIVSLIETRARESYARREMEYPVEHVLAFAFGGENGTTDNPYACDFIRGWVKAKYDLEIPLERMRSMSVAQLRDELVGQQRNMLAGEGLDRVIDQIIAEGNGDTGQTLAAFNRRFATTYTPADVSTMPRPKLPPESPEPSLYQILHATGRSVLRKELTDLEQYVLINIFDQSWKDQLYSMDVLRGSIGLQAFAERDPRVLYKKEGYAMFAAMMVGIRDKVTDLIFRARVQGQVQAKSAYRETSAVHADSGGYGVAENVAVPTDGVPAPAGAVAPAAMPAGAATGPRSDARPDRAVQAVKTIIRNVPRVGRNDPCPCGSGKKYKKCHGADAE